MGDQLAATPARINEAIGSLAKTENKEIDRAIAVLNKTIGLLEENFSSLEMQLSPIRASFPVSTEEAVAPLSVFDSPLAESIQQSSSRVDTLNKAIQHLAQEVQL